MVTSGEFLNVCIDPGNGDIKAMIHGDFGYELVFPHAVLKFSDADYKVEALPYRDAVPRWKDTAMFELDGVGYLVGQHALDVLGWDRVVGSSKYTREHMGALLGAALLLLYPDGHESIRLVVSHPAKIEPYELEALKASVSGRFEFVLPNGKRVKYRVRSVVLRPESLAAMQSFLLSTKFKEYERGAQGVTLEPGMDILSVDVGAFISFITPGKVRDDYSVEFNLAAAQRVNKGIIDVMTTLARELKRSVPEYRNRERFPQDLLYSALINREVNVYGKPVACFDAVDKAMVVIGKELQPIYTNAFGGGQDAHLIAVSGGGGAAAFPYLVAEVLKHPRVVKVERESDKRPDLMRFAVVRGLSKGLGVFLAQQKARASRA